MNPRSRKARRLIARQQPAMIGAWLPVELPSGWAWDPLPLDIQRQGRRFRPAPSFNLRSYANISVAKTYYVDCNATGANNGSSWTDAFTGLWNALTQADVDRIYIAKGYYHRNSSWSGVSPSRSVEIIGVLSYGTGDAVYITSDCKNQFGSWSLVDSHYQASTGGRTVTHVVDRSNENSFGDGQYLTLRASVAEVDSNPNSYYISSGTIYVQTFDSRQPDSSMLFCEGGPPFNLQRDSITVYAENLTCWGGSTAGYMLNASATGGLKVYLKNCTFQYSYSAAGNIVSAWGCDETIFWNCLAAGSREGDGFNYKARNGIVPKAIEIDCEAYNNGDAATDQGSTIHDAGTILRLMGRYHHNYGQCIADVGNSVTWCLGSQAYSSLSTSTTRHGFLTEGTMWLDRCRSYLNDDYDLVCTAAGDAIYHRLFASDDHAYLENGGVITAY